MPAHAQRMSSLLAGDKKDASCRVERGACDVGRGVRAGRRERAWGSGSTSGAHAERTRLEGSGGRVRAAERTENIQRISVTLDVSKFTGWLKAHVACRVESRACDEGRGVRAGRRGS